MQSCRACGQGNHDDELFCQRCGRFLESVNRAELATAPPNPVGRRGPVNRAELGQLHVGDAVCAVCRAGNAAERTFCRGCGTRISRDDPFVGARPGAAVIPRGKRVGMLRPVGIGLLALVCLVGLGIGAVQVWSKGEATSSCPKAATISRVHAAAGDAFSVKDTRRDTGRIVLQFRTTWPRTVSGALIVSICRTGRGEYWYFARDSEDAPTGTFIPAAVLPDGSFRATSPKDEVFIVNGAGLSINGKGLTQAQPLCTSLDKIDAAWETTTFTSAPRCNASTVRPWFI